MHISNKVLRLLGRYSDVVIKLIGISLLFTGEGMSYASQWVYACSSKIETGLNIKFTCREETLTEVIRWLHKCPLEC